MTLLLPREALRARREVAAGALAPLAEGIAQDLEPVLAHPVFIPEEKALLSREGGRCPRDGTQLEFDPFDQDRHRCPTCGEVQSSEWHRRFWPYWYQLWLAERAVHAAALLQVRRHPRYRTFVADVLNGYAARYLDYPAADSVLGPSRPFFSTYLESVWLLQLCLALDLLELSDAAAVDGPRIRERLIAPSLDLIASYDEGLSNRQVWNVAAQIAARRVLDRRADVQPLVEAPHGLEYLLANGLLPDGTWYEGENYHLFAHRGLWYGVMLARAAGAEVDPRLVERFRIGFVAPLLTAYPDLTLPSRRDSQFAISLRQPRVAESCELGLAMTGDERLAALLHALYDAPPDVPAADNGRARTAADIERNLPPMRLSRADLGWRSLLFALPELPPPAPLVQQSVLLEGQGIAVLRRDDGRRYAALDYGHAGGGHGHPDRLGVLLFANGARVLDDMGTGSYVDRSLHWYRSTLAHNAPLVDGVSQRPADGRLLAFDEVEGAGGAAWVRAAVDGIADGVHLERTIALTDRGLVDELTWRADRAVTLDIPWHVALDPRDDGWEAAPLAGGTGLEDGFEFVRDARRRRAAAGDVLALAPPGEVRPLAWIAADGPADWWQAVAPGPPGEGDRPFYLVRVRAASGRVRAVWSAEPLDAVRFEAGAVRLEDGGAVEVHRATPRGWRIERTGTDPAAPSLELGGMRDVTRTSGPVVPGAAAGTPERTPDFELRAGVPMLALLAADDYRRSEPTWEEAGEPRADVRIEWDGRCLSVRARVHKREPIVFVPPGAVNPLDNEPPEINGDGMQLYVIAGGRRGGWTIVPVEHSRAARARPVRGWDDLLLDDARWADTVDGYELTASLVVAGADEPVRLGLAINETAAPRARRRGQLVLGGARGEWVYLRGDRLDEERLLRIRLL